MSGTAPRVIQFIHPGFEYKGKTLGPRPQATGVMRWKRGRSEHNRKYLIARGAAMDPTSGERHVDTTLGFWGEWEAPSRWRRAEHAVPAYHPSVFHEPSRPASPPEGSRQNTDPLVFGEAFVYSNCKQDRSAMQRMPAGSIVLFGRGMKVDGVLRFTLDTCFVVDRFDPLTLTPGEVAPYGEDLVSDLVLGPLLTEGEVGRSLAIYRGRHPRPDGADEPFSFFPAVLAEERPEGFARPVLHPTGPLQGRITENLTQGQKPTCLPDGKGARAVWQAVVDQVVDQGCLLGVHAEPPRTDGA